MDERSILTAQIEALLEDLRRAHRALDAQQITPDLRQAVHSRFGRLINSQEEDLADLQKGVRSGLPLGECWSAFRDTRQECVSIFRECLAFLEGALVRSAGLDEGFCRLADALLDDLSRRTDIHWARLTILAEEEFFAQMAEIIRLRFPEFSIWSLPIAAHEFGHLVGQELKALRPDGTYRYPFQEILQREGQVDRRNVPFLREHFADLFAAYSLGPAYACTCILLRFDPWSAHQDGREHPSYAKRARFVLRGLERMDETEALRQPYRGMTQHLSNLWQQSLMSARQPGTLDQATAAQLNEWLEELYFLLHREMPPAARYQGWPQAQRLSCEFLSDKKPAQLLDSEDTLADVLNAAWLCRVQHWNDHGYQARQVSQRAVELCREIIRRRS